MLNDETGTQLEFDLKQLKLPMMMMWVSCSNILSVTSMAKVKVKVSVSKKYNVVMS